MREKDIGFESYPEVHTGERPKQLPGEPYRTRDFVMRIAEVLDKVTNGRKTR